LSIDPLEALKLDLEPLSQSINKAMISFGERHLQLRLMAMALKTTPNKSSIVSHRPKIIKVVLDNQDLLSNKE